MAWTLLSFARQEIGCSEFMHSNLIKLFSRGGGKNPTERSAKPLKKGAMCII